MAENVWNMLDFNSFSLIFKSQNLFKSNFFPWSKRYQCISPQFFTQKHAPTALSRCRLAPRETWVDPCCVALNAPSKRLRFWRVASWDCTAQEPSVTHSCLQSAAAVNVPRNLYQRQVMVLSVSQRFGLLQSKLEAKYFWYPDSPWLCYSQTQATVMFVHWTVSPKQCQLRRNQTKKYHGRTQQALNNTEKNKNCIVWLIFCRKILAALDDCTCKAFQAF